MNHWLIVGMETYQNLGMIGWLVGLWIWLVGFVDLVGWICRTLILSTLGKGLKCSKLNLKSKMFFKKNDLGHRSTMRAFFLLSTYSHLANGPWKKSLNFIFPTKYVIPKSLKFSHCSIFRWFHFNPTPSSADVWLPTEAKAATNKPSNVAVTGGRPLQRHWWIAPHLCHGQKSWNFRKIVVPPLIKEILIRSI